MRIVSLFPAATEIVCALGLRDYLVGISHSCPQAGELAKVPRLTAWRGPENGTSAEIDNAVSQMLRRGEPLYDFDAGELLRLRPTIVLAQSLCNVCAVSESVIRKTVRSVGARIWEWSPRSVEDILSGIGEIARLCGHPETGGQLASALRCRLFNVSYLTGLIGEPTRVVFLEWLAPLYAAGHWIPELVEFAGGENVLGTPGMRSMRISFEQLAAADPDVIIVGCCGWSRERTWEELELLIDLPQWQNLRAVQTKRIHVVDAETCFTAPGASIANATEELARIIHFASPSKLYSACYEAGSDTVCSKNVVISLREMELAEKSSRGAR